MPTRSLPAHHLRSPLDSLARKPGPLKLMDAGREIPPQGVYCIAEISSRIHLFNPFFSFKVKFGVDTYAVFSGCYARHFLVHLIPASTITTTTKTTSYIDNNNVNNNIPMLHHTIRGQTIATGMNVGLA